MSVTGRLSSLASDLPVSAMENLALFFCTDPGEGRNFYCGGFGEFWFSPISGRYLLTYTMGYWEGEDSNENTPLMDAI